MNSEISLVRIGRLLPGCAEVGEGVNRPFRCVAATHSGEVAVIAKKLSDREIAVEIVCAIVGRAAGLPIPEPLLLVNDEQEWHYGSVDLGHPNLYQYVSADDSSILIELAQWPMLLHAACFDELIANPDRHDGNLLYDGAGFFLIDHGMCMPDKMSATDTSSDYHNNQLLELHINELADDVSVQRSVSGVRDWTANSGRRSIELADQAMVEHVEIKPKEELISFLRNRIDILTDLLHERIKPSQQRRLRLND